VAAQGHAEAVCARGVARPLKLKDPVSTGQGLRTGKGGRLHVQFSDGTLLALGGATELRVTDYTFDPKTRDGAMAVGMANGLVQVVGGTLPGRAPIRFRAGDSAAFDVRGSFFAARRVGEGMQIVALDSGTVAVSTAAGRARLEKPGRATTVTRSDARPGPLTTLSSDEMAALSADVCGGQSSGERREKKPCPFAEWGYWDRAFDTSGNSLQADAASLATTLAALTDIQDLLRDTVQLGSAPGSPISGGGCGPGG
jgi:hypothetical protein